MEIMKENTVKSDDFRVLKTLPRHRIFATYYTLYVFDFQGAKTYNFLVLILCKFCVDFNKDSVYTENNAVYLSGRCNEKGRPIRGGLSLLSRASCSAQIVPEIVSVLVPGLTLYAPAAFWVNVAAGTVMTPATVANPPVAAS